MVEPLPLIPRGRDRETQMLDDAVAAVVADPELGAGLEKLSARLGQRFSSAVTGAHDEETAGRLMHEEAKRALAHVMLWSGKTQVGKWRAQLAIQCGHTLALITTAEALLAAVNAGCGRGEYWEERKALHQAIQSAQNIRPTPERVGLDSDAGER